MSTGRKLVSDVRGTHRLLSTDAMINDRVIFSEVKNSSWLLIKRETNLRRLWATDTIFTTIPCLNLEEVPVSECLGYVDNCTIARSVHKLPKVAEGNYQYVIQGVYSINALSGKGKKIKEISLNRYINSLKLPVIKNEGYFMIVDDYLYVTNPFVKAVRIAALFVEDIPNSIRYEECSCGGNVVTDDEWCMNPLDRKFPLPEYLEDQVVSLTSQKLLERYFRIKADITKDGMDGQAPNVPELR